MKQVKSIILLITLFFVSSISILILKNLSDSDKFLKVVQTSSSLTQTNLTVINIQNEILKLFKKEQNNLDKLFKFLPETLPLNFENINIKIDTNQIDPKNYYNLNDKLLKTKIDNEFKKNINYMYDFFSLSKDKNISSFKQIDYIINEYIDITTDKDILNIKDKFIYFDTNDTNNTYVSCNYDLDVSGLKSHSNMIFKVGELKPMVFYFYFK
jgi:hypothetical protein